MSQPIVQKKRNHLRRNDADYKIIRCVKATWLEAQRQKDKSFTKRGYKMKTVMRIAG